MLGKKGREEALKKQRRERGMRSETRSVFVRENRKSTPHQSLFSPLFSTSVRSFESQEWSIFFLFFASKRGVSTQNSSFLKHRIHPKHGSGRTSSLTRSNT